MSIPSALAGAIVFIWFPEEEAPHKPGPKYRPALITEVDLERKRLLAVYGTSQNTERQGKGEITFTTAEITGLSKDTKFCLGKSVWLPLEAEYLTQDGKLSVVGRVPSNRSRDLLQAIEEVKAG